MPRSPAICVACGTQHENARWGRKVRVVWVKKKGLEVGTKLLAPFRASHPNGQSELRLKNEQHICNQLYKVWRKKYGESNGIVQSLAETAPVGNPAPLRLRIDEYHQSVVLQEALDLSLAKTESLQDMYDQLRNTQDDLLKQLQCLLDHDKSELDEKSVQNSRSLLIGVVRQVFKRLQTRLKDRNDLNKFCDDGLTAFKDYLSTSLLDYYENGPAQFCKLWNAERGLEHVRIALSKAGIRQFEGAPGPLPIENSVNFKKASLGLLVDPELIEELVAAATAVDGDGNLLKGAPAGEKKLSIGPKCDRFFMEMFSSLPTSSIPVERAINMLKNTGFGRGVGNQSGLRTEAKVGAGLDVDVADVTEDEWKEAANEVRAAEGTHVDKSAYQEEARKVIEEAPKKEAERQQKVLVREAAQERKRQVAQDKLVARKQKQELREKDKEKKTGEAKKRKRQERERKEMETFIKEREVYGGLFSNKTYKSRRLQDKHGVGGD